MGASTSTNAVTAPAAGTAVGILGVFILKAIFPHLEIGAEIGVAIGTLCTFGLGLFIKPSTGP